MYAHCIWASHDGKTPILCAAEAGHDEIVAYLLEFEEVQDDLKNQQKKVENASVSKSTQWAARGRVCNYIKFETGRSLLPVLEIITHTLHASQVALWSRSQPAVKLCQPWLTRLA